MPRFDRYLLSQLLVHFGFFALVLVGVYWINRAVLLFDQLMGDGQSALVFLKFSVLTLPGVIRIVLPFAGFIAAVFVTNKLTVESELVVMQATGFSAFRMARPVLTFGLILAVMMTVLVHVLVPLSRATMVTERAALSENITAGFLTDGQFTHPSKGVTFYMTGVDDRGQLLGLFLEDARRPDQVTTFTARSALFLRGASGPKLIMFDGMAQVLNTKNRSVAVTRFTDFTYDLGAILTRSVGRNLGLAEQTTLALIAALPADPALIEATPSERSYEIHSRMAEPLLSVVVVLVGFASLLQGTYSRLGLWRQIGLALVLLVAVQGLWTALAASGRAMAAGGGALAYVAPAFGLVLAWILLWWSGRPRPRPRPRSAAMAEASVA